MYALDQIIVIGSVVLFASVIASKLADRMGVPILLFFLSIGIVLGEPQMNLSYLKNVQAAKLIGMVTLAFILFFGGLETSYDHIKPILWRGVILSTFGTLLTALLSGLFLRYITNGYLGFAEGLLVGAIISSTDAAAVFSILKSRNIKLKYNLGPLLELESGSNDVMVYFLMSFLLKILQGKSANFYWAAPDFFMEMAIGALGGLAMGYGMLFILNKINLSYPGLYPIMALSMITLGYGMTNMLHGSGFLAVYIGGMILGNQDFIHRKGLIRFYKGISWLTQISMFIMLGILVTPEKLLSIIPLGAKLCLFLIIVARPVSVFLSLLGSHFQFKHKAFISWVGLRGAVPIIFGTYLYALDREKADVMFHLIFFIVFVSILLQGTSLHPLAKYLGLQLPIVSKKKKELLAFSDEVKKIFLEFEIPPESSAIEKHIVELGLPKNSYIILICRDNTYMTVHGKTIVKPYDKFYILMDTKKEMHEVKAVLGIK